MGAKNLAGSSDSNTEACSRVNAHHVHDVSLSMLFCFCFTTFQINHMTNIVYILTSSSSSPLQLPFSRYPNKRLASKMRRLSNMASPCPIISSYVTPNKIKLQQFCRHHHFVFSIMY